MKLQIKGPANVALTLNIAELAQINALLVQVNGDAKKYPVVDRLIRATGDAVDACDHPSLAFQTLAVIGLETARELMGTNPEFKPDREPGEAAPGEDLHTALVDVLNECDCEACREVSGRDAETDAVKAFEEGRL